MKAIVCSEFGPVSQLQYLDVEAPRPASDQLLIENKAIGVNFPDAIVVQGHYQVPLKVPFYPGFESAGIVRELGSKVSGFSVGDRVMLYNPDVGTYAEQIAIRADLAVKIPESMSFEHAATLFCATCTAHHGLKQRGQLQEGETLLVLGAAGGTGLSAVQVGKAMGARVIAACSSDEKLALAKESGADELINYAKEDLKKSLKALTGGRGIDVVYDPVGSKLAEVAAKNLAWNGRHLVVGFASGEIPSFPANLTLVKGIAIMGVFWGTFTQEEPETNAANIEQLLQWYVEGKIKPVIDSIEPLENAVHAIEKVASRQVKGKIILKV